MASDNSFIADQFSLLSKLMDIHGENSFKARSYSAAAFSIDRLPQPLSELPADKIATLKGIGDSAARKIREILETGRLQALDDLLMRTPAGILEMMQIKGLGPKKIAVIWKEMDIETIGELLYACNENRLLRYKGFGEKTQAQVKAAIEFFLQHQGSHLYAEIETYAWSVHAQLQKLFPENRFDICGAFRRQSPVIEILEWVTDANADRLATLLEKNNYTRIDGDPEALSFRGPENIRLQFHRAAEGQSFSRSLFEKTGSPAFVEACTLLPGWRATAEATTEEDIWSALQVPAIAPCLRDEPAWLQRRERPVLIEPEDIKGIIHSHSTWSDGLHSLEEMAEACVQRGMEYLVISDHSKSAFYANGLNEERIRAQHQLIEELNKKLNPFRIFKSIECDILSDGSLDYSDEILAGFDLVIASVHSNLKMTEDKAMMRLLRAIRHPRTTILGHMTGRLLLSRPGYPVDHKAIIDACAEEKVVIELNAHPRRLDIDWSWIGYALEKGVLISIDPDAHAIEGYEDCRYGVLAAQKAGVSKESNLSSFSRQELVHYLEERKKAKGMA